MSAVQISSIDPIDNSSLADGILGLIFALGMTTKVERVKCLLQVGVEIDGLMQPNHLRRFIFNMFKI